MLVTGASIQGVEARRKRAELRYESDSLRRGSGNNQASKKSSEHHKQIMPVPETDTGGEVE